MSEWSVDIVRQQSWDLWTLVCVVGAGVLVAHAVLTKAWANADRRALWLTAAGVVGTIAVVGVPALRNAKVGLVWTFALLCILSTVFYLKLPVPRGRRRVLLGMRYAALALLVPMLFEPVVRFVSRPKPERPLVFVVDASGSMSFPDVQNGPTRLQSAWQAIRGQLPTLREHFLPMFFTFADGFKELKSAEQLGTATPDGKSTDIVNGIAKALAATNRDDAQVVLISDGIDNTSPNVVDVVGASRRPVHAVRVGSDSAEPAAMANVSVDDVRADDDFVVGNESVVRAVVRSTALTNRVVDVNMAEADAAGKPTSPPVIRKLVLQPAPGGQTVDLPYKPTRVGVHRLAVWVDPVPGERSTVDNRQEFQGLAIDPRVKVLYVEGRARPEYRELSRALGRDPNVELATLLRIQAERFAAGGFVDGKPFKQMPRTLDEWRKFDVIILGDLDSSFLPRVQQAMVEQAVQAGAGLLMIGGQNSLGPGGYKETAIERALPVFVGELNAPQEKSPFVPKLTDDGRSHPAMEGLAEWFGGGRESEDGKKEPTPASSPSSILNPPSSLSPRALPPLRGNVVVSKAKSGAQTLLVHDRAGAEPQVVLATHRYGEGRAAAFTADTTYLWYLPLRAMGQDSPYNRFWGQLVRWLAGADVRNRDRGPGLEALLNKTVFQLGERVRVRAMVRDEKGDATRYAQVSLSLTRGAGVDGRPAEARQLSMAPAESRAGMYDVTIDAPDKGDYAVTLVATKDGRELGRQDLKFAVIAPADEMLRLAANPDLLRAVAAGTRGFYYELPQLGTLVSELVRTGAGDTGLKQRTVPLHNFVRAGAAATVGDPGWPKKYDLPLQGLLAIGILSTEWFLRRRWQLP